MRYIDSWLSGLGLEYIIPKLKANGITTPKKLALLTLRDMYEVGEFWCLPVAFLILILVGTLKSIPWYHRHLHRSHPQLLIFRNLYFAWSKLAILCHHEPSHRNCIKNELFKTLSSMRSPSINTFSSKTTTLVLFFKQLESMTPRIERNFIFLFRDFKQ